MAGPVRQGPRRRRLASLEVVGTREVAAARAAAAGGGEREAEGPEAAEGESRLGAARPARMMAAAVEGAARGLRTRERAARLGAAAAPLAAEVACVKSNFRRRFSRMVDFHTGDCGGPRPTKA